MWGFGGALLVVALDFPHFLCSLGFSSFFSMVFYYAIGLVFADLWRASGGVGGSSGCR
jgi:hypothetical protein